MGKKKIINLTTIKAQWKLFLNVGYGILYSINNNINKRVNKIYFLILYLKTGAGYPWAGHSNEISDACFSSNGLLIIEGIRGAVLETGSKQPNQLIVCFQ